MLNKEKVKRNPLEIRFYRTTGRDFMEVPACFRDRKSASFLDLFFGKRSIHLKQTRRGSGKLYLLCNHRRGIGKELEPAHWSHQDQDVPLAPSLIVAQKARATAAVK